MCTYKEKFMNNNEEFDINFLLNMYNYVNENDISNDKFKIHEYVHDLVQQFNNKYVPDRIMLTEDEMLLLSYITEHFIHYAISTTNTKYLNIEEYLKFISTKTYIDFNKMINSYDYMIKDKINLCSAVTSLKIKMGHLVFINECNYTPAELYEYNKHEYKKIFNILNLANVLPNEWFESALSHIIGTAISFNMDDILIKEGISFNMTTKEPVSYTTYFKELVNEYLEYIVQYHNSNRILDNYTDTKMWIEFYALSSETNEEVLNINGINWLNANDSVLNIICNNNGIVKLSFLIIDDYFDCYKEIEFSIAQEIVPENKYKYSFRIKVLPYCIPIYSR